MHIVALKKQGKTIFITTHNMNTADELCDRVAFIVDGTLQVTEAPALLKHQHGRDLVKVDLQGGQTAEFPLEKLGQNAEFLALIRDHQLLRINTLEATLERSIY